MSAIKNIDLFFQKMDGLGLALSYGDVRLKTKSSDVALLDISMNTHFSKNVPLKIPIVSSPMDTVTGAKMAIAMAKRGGLGIIHRNFDPETQASKVNKVKLSLNYCIQKPITVTENRRMRDVMQYIEKKGFDFRTFPVLNDAGKLVGLLTSNDFDFCVNMEDRVVDVMSKMGELITAKPGITAKDAYTIMAERKKKVLPLIDDDGYLAGMYIFSDVRRKMIEGGATLHNVDQRGNLRVGAAIGIGEEALHRAELLVSKNVDVLVIDTAHGDSLKVYETLKKIKESHNVDVVVGNVSEPQSVVNLIKVGADGIKVGQGPGSICTTRIIAGIGCPQVTAVYNCAKAARDTSVSICADGGIKYSGDITIALGIGAQCVMLGNLLAGTDEAPGVVIPTANGPMKQYRGMGSLGAMQDSQESRERYGQTGKTTDKLVPEGVEGTVPYKGRVDEILFQLLGGLRSGMGYLGARNIEDLQNFADLHRISGEGSSESHPSVSIMHEAPNYRR